MGKSKSWNDKQKETNSYKGLLNHFVSLTEDSAFLEKVSDLRMKYELPIKGVGEDEDIFDSYFADMDLWCDFQIEVQGLAKKYGLSWNWMRETLRDFVIYNKVIEPTSGLRCFSRPLSITSLKFFLTKSNTSLCEAYG